jgi:hypothetical protein
MGRGYLIVQAEGELHGTKEALCRIEKALVLDSGRIGGW